MSGFRLEARAGIGLEIDRNRPLRFRFNGRALTGLAGDTLASALIANGVSIVGRSFKYHRPRGVMGIGAAETNALVQLEGGARTTPNVLATLIPLYDGLEARSVNCWPSVDFDLAAVNDRLSPLLAAGFYYKTFMWPGWRVFEPFIRRAAGLGTAPTEADPDRYEARALYCDVLVAGAGPAGLAAALAAARAGAKVVLAESEARLGDGAIDDARTATIEAELASMANVTVLRATTVIGYYDHNLLTAVEAVNALSVRQRLWKIRAARVVLATGAIERPMVFPDNDRPGVMLAGAVQQHISRYAAAPGRRLVLFTNNDGAYDAAFAAVAAGLSVQAVIDVRHRPGDAVAQRAADLGQTVLTGATVIAVAGRRRVEGVTIRLADGRTRRIACDGLAVSGGWTPSVHLFSQSGGLTRYDSGLGGFVPGQGAQATRSCGAAQGVFDLDACRADGGGAGAEAAALAGHGKAGQTTQSPAREPVEPLRQPPLAHNGGKAFVDLQTDVTVRDLRVATQENYRSVEHVKRYTVWGMGTDQGKLSGAAGNAVLSQLQNSAPAHVGATKFRPPYTPTSFGALAAGRPNHALFRPWKLLPAHAWHLRHGAAFEDFGWLRPSHYPQANETMHQAAQREVSVMRQGVGLLDSSSFGKIEVKGPQAAAFLDHIYCGPVTDLKVGGVRYGLMLNELGVVMDDGVFGRLAADHFLLLTSSAHADTVFRWLEDWRQCEWPMEVMIQNVTSQWATLALVGPRARAVLTAAGTDIDLAPAALPHMELRTGRLAGVPIRLQRTSFTGALTFEISCPAHSACVLFDLLFTAGAPFGIVPVGLEALETARIERGSIDVGTDTDSNTQPQDLGFPFPDKAVDFLGKRSLLHPAARSPTRQQLVGLAMVDPGAVLPVGGHIIGGAPHPSQGFVTSSAFSRTLGRGVALALLNGGRSRHGETISVWSDGRTWPATVTAPRALNPRKAAHA